jgi:hypothetical protein
MRRKLLEEVCVLLILLIIISTVVESSATQIQEYETEIHKLREQLQEVCYFAQMSY